ncbi:hypothetical protein M3Y99_01320900 [Aphelenchoides fujianensis]|nr:hypothetical protein M3Y99_01320900 [Aphelenchoides fujianensis]
MKLPPGLQSPSMSNSNEFHQYPFVMPRVPSETSPASSAEFRAPPMQTSVQFVNEDLELTDFIAQHLRKSSDFTVIGGIGLTNCGKSTLMSMLAGNQPRDKFRQYVFRPAASRETIESGFFQTNGLHVFVSNETRTIFIDSKGDPCSLFSVVHWWLQPFNSGAVFEDHVRKAKADSKAIYKDVQTEAMILLSFLFEICHSVVFCVDWFVDINAVHEVLRAAVFSEFNFRKFASFPKTTNLVVLHHRALERDYEMHVVRQRAQMLRSTFADSRWNVLGGLSMSSLGFTEYADCEPEVNYVVLGDLPQWSKDSMEEVKVLTSPFGYLLDRLRPALLGLKKPAFRSLDKIRPARRTHRREKSLNLPPTLDPKDATKLRDQHLAKQRKPLVKGEVNKPNDEADDDSTTRGSFDPDLMPNITTRQEEIQAREVWNEQLGLSEMSLPSAESAQKALLLLQTTSVEKENEFVGSLLPPAIGDVAADFSEAQWLDYARSVFEITKRTFNTKYFMSSNGRIVPRIIRKLRSSTKLLAAAAPAPAKSRRRARGRANRIDDEPSEGELAAATEDLRLRADDRESSIQKEESGRREAIRYEEKDEEDGTSESSFVLSSDSRSSSDEGDDGEQKGARSSSSEGESADSSDEDEEEDEPRTKREPLQRRRRIASDHEDEEDD